MTGFTEGVNTLSVNGWRDGAEGQGEGRISDYTGSRDD